MKKIADFIVERRRMILVLFLLLTVSSGWLMSRVDLNEDMTKYLPDDSSMKQGLDIMNGEFSDSEGSGLSSFDIMFAGLADIEKSDVYRELSAVNNVTSVEYQAESEDYNRDAYTLYRVNVGYDQYSAEARAVLESIIEKYQENYQVYTRGSIVDANRQELTPAIILLAVSILMVILFAMCASWFEPILFLVTIGIAVIINMGTNAFLGSVSSLTHSIAAVLQLALSMDYSIILIDRYRQELVKTSDKHEAMRNALTHAFPSIASSSLTTVVGLLALVFMSFKIGMDMGIVLAKGVLISLLCIYTVLPALILRFDRLIAKTQKKVLHIQLDGLGRSVHSARYGLVVLFVFLFAATSLLKGQTDMAYTLESNNKVDATFPVSNVIVMLYGNNDEAAVAALADQISEEDGVKSATCFANTIDRSYTVPELAAAMSGFGSGMNLNPSLLKVIYYDIYADGKSGTMTMETFVRFIQNDLAKNPQFASQFDAATLAQIDQLAAYTDPRLTRKQYTSTHMAGLTGVDVGMVGQLYNLYFAANGGTSDWKMALPEFVSYLKTNVVTDAEYAGYFDASTLSQVNMLATYSDPAVIQKQSTGPELAALLGMDDSVVSQLLLLRAVNAADNSDLAMSLKDFVDWLLRDVATNQQYAALFDSSTLARLQMVQNLMNASISGVQLSSSELASYLGMDNSLINQVFYMYYSAQGATNSWTMSLQDFVDFLLSDVANNPQYAANFDSASLTQMHMLQQLMNVAASGREFTSSQLASLFSSFSSQMDAQAVDVAYLYYFSEHGSNPAWTLTMPKLIDHITGNMMNDARFAGYFDTGTKTTLEETQRTLADATTQLQGGDYSRLIITTTLPQESAATTAFLDELTAQSDNTLSGDYYLIGDSAMSYEMSKSFGSEMSFITILTAIAIFVVVAITFRSLVIPAILVLLIQAAVYSMMCLIGLQGYSIYYIALLIVQCILMGATIDYGILYTSYYREKRATMNVKDALIAAYNDSIHTILTSSLIMILVTAILGNFFANPTVGQICQSISKGALCATLLIVFVLPGILASFDRFICGKNALIQRAA